MSVADVHKKITKRTKAVVPVDYAGRPADLQKFKALAKKYKLVLISDGAQSLGARYKGKPAGSFADMTTYSFHPVKSITTGEGGAVVTNNAEYARLVRLFRTHGITKESAALEHKDEGGWYMEMQTLGYNYRMPDINAALGESQIKRLKTFVASRATAAKRYNKLLAHVPPGIVLPAHDTTENKSAWHLYTLRISDPKRRREVFSYLRAQGIGVQVHHIPVHLHPYYQKLGYKKGLCPVAERWYATELSLPLFANITTETQKKVVNTFVAALAQ